ncbi:MAG: glycine cleavage system aminomethyltransferase GcvT [Deltaproteobacteria bacterium]|nr:glycine cleavage system aminomethyltransferase GcvT [Deltaproteobacteria bacterium]
MESHGPIKETPLCSAHRRLGARLIDFGGWLMPVNYPPGILEEHKATRRAVGVFDVCHMGEIHFRGPRALEAVQRLVTNDAGALPDGRAMYAVACHPDGGIVDDLIVYRVAAHHLLIVVNASNIAKDYRHFVDNAGSLCQIDDESSTTALIAFQGPKAATTLAGLVDADLAALPSFSFLTGRRVAGLPAWIARTGYTGEDGFEIFCAPADAEPLWDRLLAAAIDVSGAPVGLGARDTLRLEARLSLYGNDLDDTTTPLEAGLGWVVKFDKGDFIGKEALLRQRAAGLQRKLVGFEMRDRGIARHGYAILDLAGSVRLGQVTSGTVGPTVGKNIGMGYVPPSHAEPGTRVVVDCRGKPAQAEIIKGPFYRRPGAQKSSAKGAS